MGSVSSRNLRGNTSSDGTRAKGVEELRCRKHEERATHYDDQKSELYCRTCFQDLRHENSSILHLDHVHDVADYLRTEKFKEKDTQVRLKLNDCIITNKIHLKQIRKSKQNIATSRADILNKINHVVLKIIQWLHEEEEFVCREAEKKIEKITDELDMIEKEIKLRLTHLSALEVAFEKHRKDNSGGLLLETIIKGQSFCDKENSVKYDIPDFKIKLNLNENLKISELLGDQVAPGKLGSVVSKLTGEVLTVTTISEHPDGTVHSNLDTDPVSELENTDDKLQAMYTLVNELRKADSKDDIQYSSLGSARNKKNIFELSPRGVTYSDKSAITKSIIGHSDEDQQAKGLQGQRVCKVKEVNLPKDENIPNITDSAVLDDGGVVLCDQKNEKLILLNNDLGVESERKLNGHPHNLALVPNTSFRIAVTIPDENVIKIIEVKGKEFTSQVEVINLQTKPKCFGIEYVDRYLVYTTRNDLIVVNRTDMSEMKSFSYNFNSPVSLFADREKSVLYVSCLGVKSKGEVVKIDCVTEQVDFVVACPEIQHPVCSTVDKDKNIFICNINPPSIHKVSSKGKYLGLVLDSIEGNFQHLNFLRKGNKFLTAENDSSTVVVFEITDLHSDD